MRINPIDPIYRSHNRTGYKPPTVKQKIRWAKVRLLGCSVEGCHHTRPQIHHCGTGGGGRKDHDKVIPLCHEHHTGAEGIDGQHMSKRDWQTIYGTEEEHLRKTARLLGEVYVGN